MEILALFAAALLLDMVAGEYPNQIHPVYWMGKVISFFDAGSPASNNVLQFIYGAALSLFTIALFASAAYLALFYLKTFGTAAYIIGGALIMKSTFSLKALGQAARKVQNALANNKLDEARFELRALVSRDASRLSASQSASAAIESVAENICDSFVAPLFYFLIFGVPGAAAYRAANTLDAMIGYHGKYEYLGKFAARLDDVLNYVPARLSALLLVLASPLVGRSMRRAWFGMKQGRAKTESPNAGWTMAAAAGALGVRLEKQGHYELESAGAEPAPADIRVSVKLVQTASLIWAGICLAAGGIYFVFAT